MHVKIVINCEFKGMNSGWPTRYIGLIREIYSRHKISIFAPGKTGLLREKFPEAQVSPDTNIALKKVNGGIWGLAKDLFFPDVTSLRFAEPYSKELHQLILLDPNQYDASVYFGMDSVICYGNHDKGKNIICDFCDSLNRGLQNELRRKKRIRDKLSVLYDLFYVRRIKKKFIYPTIKILAITNVDKKCISTILPKNTIFSIPNGIKLLKCEDGENFLGTKYSSKNIIFVGSLNYEPNEISILYSLRNLWPEIHKRNPQIIFQIVGREPSLKIRDAVKNIEGVELIGPVENVYNYYLGAKCFLGPIFTGAGMKNKFLESINAGTPIITTPEGVVGLDLIHGKHGFIGYDKSELIEGINFILSDSFHGYSAFVGDCIQKAQEYGWDEIGQRLDKILTS